MMNFFHGLGELFTLFSSHIVLDLPLFWLLCATAFLASLIDAIAGGGGLITLPALLLSGIDPLMALGTNKLQSSFGSVSSSVAFARRGLLQKDKILPIFIFTFLASAGGSLLVGSFNQVWFYKIVPILLILVALYFAFSPKLDNIERQAIGKPWLVLTFVLPLIAFYDGLFGPGTGSFLTLMFYALLGMSTIHAIAHAKLANAGSNLASLLVFLSQGKVILFLGICMGVCAFLGAQIGARVAVKHGARIIKPLIILVAVSMALKLWLK